MADPHLDRAWTCPTCAAASTTAYCAHCGERRIGAGDLTLRGLLGQIAQTFSSVDGRTLRSVRSLVTHPGELTVAYLEGRRKPFLAPLQLFLLLNVLFFALQSLVGANVFSTPLESHLQQQIWSPLAQRLVAEHLAARGVALEVYAPSFDQAVALNAKSLIVLMTLPFALVLPILFVRSRLPFAAHAVFSLYFYAFLLLLFCAALLVVGGDRLLGGEGLSSQPLDHALSGLELAICAVYLYLAVGAVYGARGAARTAQVALLVVSVAAIFLAYRFALFLITLYGT